MHDADSLEPVSDDDHAGLIDANNAHEIHDARTSGYRRVQEPADIINDHLHLAPRWHTFWHRWSREGSMARLLRGLHAVKHEAWQPCVYLN